MVQVTLFPSGLSDLCIKTEWGIIPPFCQFGIIFVSMHYENENHDEGEIMTADCTDKTDFTP